MMPQACRPGIKPPAPKRAELLAPLSRAGGVARDWARRGVWAGRPGQPRPAEPVFSLLSSLRLAPSRGAPLGAMGHQEPPRARARVELRRLSKEDLGWRERVRDVPGSPGAAVATTTRGAARPDRDPPPPEESSGKRGTARTRRVSVPTITGSLGRWGRSAPGSLNELFKTGRNQNGLRGGGSPP